MVRNESFTLGVMIPEVADYNSQLSRMPCNTPQKHEIFALLTETEHVARALIYVEETGSSPVSYYESYLANAIENRRISELSWNERQFVGTVASVIMEANGWQKTGRKQRFSRGIFSSGELYRR
jgi:hypothetical protein